MNVLNRKTIGEVTNCDFTDHLRYALFPDHFRLAMIPYTIAQIQINQCLIWDADGSRLILEIGHDFLIQINGYLLLKQFCIRVFYSLAKIKPFL